MSEYILRTEGLSKEYDGHLAVNDLDLNLCKGDIYGLIGKNGAGKSTLLKMISGLSKPTCGTIIIFVLQYGTPSSYVFRFSH